MNDLTLEQQIEEVQKQLSALQEKLKQKDKLELKGGDGYILQTCVNPIPYGMPSNQTIQTGAFRATKELANIANKNMVTRNLLEAYVHDIQGNGEGEFYVSYNGYTKKYMSGADYVISKRIGAVYMKKETAEILCKALNAGEITL